MEYTGRIRFISDGDVIKTYLDFGIQNGQEIGQYITPSFWRSYFGDGTKVVVRMSGLGEKKMVYIAEIE